MIHFTQVPSWMSGTYVRNGPGQHSFGSDKRQLNNWLDGFPKLHSFKFNGDKVLFSGKMLESQNYLDSVAAGELTPQFTLNQFVNPEDDWNVWEKMEIFYKVCHVYKKWSFSIIYLQLRCIQTILEIS